MILVDAANVIGSRPDGWWKDRPGAAARFVRSLAVVHDAVVVLEGQSRSGCAVGVHDGVRVVHAPGSGDDVLAELCAPGVVLVTADRELRARALRAGATVQGPRWLWSQLAASSRADQVPGSASPSSSE